MMKSSFKLPHLRLLLCCLLLTAFQGGYSQTITSIQDGPWNNTNTWAGGVIPTAANSAAIVVAHNVSIPSAFSVTIDGTTINAGVTLTVNSGGSLIIANVPAALTVNGTLRAQHNCSITGSTGTNVSFAANSVYRHEFTTTEGRVPLAVWDITSTVEVVGYTTFRNATASGNWSQAFGNFTYNCTAQSQSMNFTGLLTSVAGNLNVLSTGTNSLIFSISQNPTINIGGNFTIAGTSVIILSATGTGAIFNIGGDFSYNTTGNSYATTSGSTTLNITGNYNHNGGVFRPVAGADGITTFNLNGDFNLVSGTLREDGTGTARCVINFNRNGVQNFVNSGLISNTFHYTIAASSILDVAGESQLIGDGSSQLTVNGTIRVGSVAASGAISLGSGTGTGNIRTAIRTYNTGSVISYDGTSTQFVGNGHPTTANVNLEVNNAAGLTLNTSSPFSTLTIGGDLILTAGSLNIVSSPSVSRTLVINNSVSSTGGTISFSGGNSHLSVTGTGSTTIPVLATSIINSLTVNRPGGGVTLANNFTVAAVTGTSGSIIFSGTPTVTGPVIMNGGILDFDGGGTITGSTSLATGTLLRFEGQSLTMTGAFTSTGGTLSSDGSSTLILSGSPAFGTLVFSGGGNTLGTLTINKTGSGTVASLNSPLTISAAFNLTDGIFSHSSGLTMGAGSVITRDPNSPLVGAAPGGGPYSIVYVGGSLTPGIEINGNFDNLTSNSSGTVTISAPLTVPGTLTVNSGTFTTNTNAVNVASLIINGGTFNAPTSTLTLTGNFTNNATFNSNGGTVVFNGNSVISGSGSKVFRHLTVNANQTLDISNQTITLNIGHLTINSGVNLTTTNSTVQFTGGAVQNLSANGAGLNNITVNKTSGSVSITSAVNLLGTLTIQSSTAVASNGNLTVRSTSENTLQDARIAALPTGASVTGNVVVQRFIGARDNVDRFISSAVTNATVAQLQDGQFFVTGQFTGTSFPCTGCNNNGSSLRYYDETVLGAFELGYRRYPSASNGEPLVPGRGYLNYMWNGVAPITVDVNGPINQGPVNFTVSHTPSSPPNADNDGWNLLGNPYPSSIAWNNGAGWTKSQIHSLVYVWDVAAGVYRTYNADNGLGDLTNGVIAMGQSFWVYALQPGATIGINENAKTSLSGSYLRKETAQYNGMTISLRYGEAVDNSFILVGKHHAETKAPKLYGSENLSIASVDENGRKLVFNIISDELAEVNIPLYLTAKNAGSYEISFSTMGNFVPAHTLYLEDRYRGTKTPASMPYAFSITENPNSISDRFFLTSNPESADQEINLNLNVFPNPVSDEFDVEINSGDISSVSLSDYTGRVVAEIPMQNRDGISRGKGTMRAQPAGFYYIQANANGKMLIKKVIKY